MNLNKLNNSHLFSLKNKVTIVAGASKGIGLAISKGFKQNGAFVIGLSRKKNNTNFFDLYFDCDVTNKNDLSEVNKILKQTYNLEFKIKSSSSYNNQVLMKKLLIDVCELATF